jgi:hypothetical protein
MVFQTYSATGNAETVMDVVDNISPGDTPCYTMFAKVKVNGDHPEWLTDTLRARTSNAAIEGATITYQTVTARSKTGSYTQIFTGGFQISETQEAVDKYGVASEEAYQKEKGLAILKGDIEYALHNGTGNVGTATGARELMGIPTWITTNVETGTGTGSEALISAMLNKHLKDIWTVSGVMPTKIVMGGFQAYARLGSSTYFAENTRTIDADKAKLNGTIMVYKSYFGEVAVVLSRDISSSVVYALSPEKFQIGILRGIKSEEMPKTSDAVNFRLVCELTLVSLNQAASGQITGLSTS